MKTTQAFDSGDMKYTREIDSYLTNLQNGRTGIDFFKAIKLKDTKSYLLTFYASFFTNNDHDAALISLESAKPRIHSDDEVTSSFFIGMFLSLSLSIGILLLIPGDMEFNADKIYAVFPVFRYNLIICLSLFGISICLKIFQKYRINYVYIFGMSPPHGSINFNDLQKLAVSYFYVWLLCLFLQIVAFKYSLLPTHSSEFALFLMLIPIGFLILPLNSLNRQARYEFVYTFFRVAMAPFTEVRFIDFFLADVLCSAVKPLQDICFCICYFTTTAWINNEQPSCFWLPYAAVFMGILPFYWRFMQCLRKYKENGRQIFPHLLNAGKYLSSVLIGVLNLVQLLFKIMSIKMYVTLYIVTTLYSYIWDISVDWGLLQLKSKHHLLRDELKFEHKYYYIGIIVNLFLRFTWTLTLFADELLNKSQFGLNLLILFLSIAELARRVQWSIFRVENESVNNNDEKYRDFADIPIVLDDYL